MNEIELLKAELEQTRIAYEMVTQINQIKTGFLGRIAHELRSPLASLMGLHQLILADLCESPEEERDCIAQAYQAAQKFLKMIDDIVNVSKIEYGTISLNLEKISLEQLLADLHQLTYLQAANRNLKLEISCLSSDLYFVADYQRLLSVLLILIDGVISVQESGTIQVLASLNHNSSLGMIQIQLNCPFAQWKQKTDQPTNGIELASFSSSVEDSLNFKFILSQKLITMMKGEMFLRELSPRFEQDYTTQIEIILPL